MIDTRCLDCDDEFSTKDVTLTTKGWACPRCNSINIERILNPTHSRKPFVYEKTKVSYKEGEGH
jgi:DNA-directed RNA polymerase subunit RPC12/RpoP